MKLSHLFETRSQEAIHHNPSVATLKALARNNRYHSARFVITKDGDVVAGDSEHHTHHSMAPYIGAWAVRGYVQYMGDGEYAYRSMDVYSALNKDHPTFRIWERAGIENGNPDQSHLGEHVVKHELINRTSLDLFHHLDRTLDNQVQVEKLDSNLDGLVIYRNQQVAAYLLVQEHQGNYWMLEARTMPQYRRQGLNSVLIDSAVKKYGRVFADMELTPDSIKALESYLLRTPYKIQRLDTASGHLHDYNPHNSQDQMTPMYDTAIDGVNRPASKDAAHWVWSFSYQKPRHPLLMGYVSVIDRLSRPQKTHLESWSRKYKKSINCNNPKGFSQRAHCAARKLRQKGVKTKSRSINEAASRAPTKDEENKIRELKNQGFSNTKIDQIMGKPNNWTSGVISSHMRDLIQKVPVAHLLSPQDVQQMVTMLRGGSTMEKIADFFGVSRTAVKSRLKNLLSPEEYIHLTQDKGALLTIDDELRMVQQFKQQPNILKLSRDFDVSQTTVRGRLIKHLGQETFDQMLAGRWPEELKQFVKQQYVSGVGPTTITAILNKSLEPNQTPFGVSQVWGIIQHSPDYREMQQQFLTNQRLKKEKTPAVAPVHKRNKNESHW